MRGSYFIWLCMMPRGQSRNIKWGSPVPAYETSHTFPRIELFHCKYLMFPILDFTCLDGSLYRCIWMTMWNTPSQWHSPVWARISHISTRIYMGLVCCFSAPPKWLQFVLPHCILTGNIRQRYDPLSTGVSCRLNKSEQK